MERSLIQLKSDFQEFATAHHQINSFFWGDFNDAIERDAIEYPLMVCTLQPSQLGSKYTGVDLQVIICDKYSLQDYRIIDEVHSDSYRVLKDVDITLRQFRFQDYLDLETDLSTEPFINRGKDITAGWSGIFRMRIHDYENRCAIPQTGFNFDDSTTGTGCASGVVNVKQSDGSLLSAATVASNGIENFTLSDSVITLADSLGTTISTTNVLATDPATITAPDGTVNVNQSDSTLISAVSVLSNGLENYNVADSVITVNTAPFADLKATDALDIPVHDSEGSDVGTVNIGVVDISDSIITLNTNQVTDNVLAEGSKNYNLLDVQGNPIVITGVVGDDVTLDILRNTASLMRTGQTTVFATGDDADENYGRNFFTLEESIEDLTFGSLSGAPWTGNTNRFTDTLGGQTYTNDIVVDWSTYNVKNGEVLMYNRNFSIFLIGTWSVQVSNANTYDDGTYSDWRLANLNETINVASYDTTISRRFNYAPFNSTVGAFWTSTSISASNAILFRGTGDVASNIAKTVETSALIVRTGNISEL